MSDNHTSSPEGFFYQPNTIKWILRIFYGLCIILIGLDFIIHRHISTPIEKIPTFYGVFGFISCVILVLIASQMRKWVMRGEHYYKEESYDAESEQVENKKSENENIKRKARNTNE